MAKFSVEFFLSDISDKIFFWMMTVFPPKIDIVRYFNPLNMV